jgi:hypothetical protein
MSIYHFVCFDYVWLVQRTDSALSIFHFVCSDHSFSFSWLVDRARRQKLHHGSGADDCSMINGALLQRRTENKTIL